MKRKLLLCALPMATIVAISSCKKKQEPTTTTTPVNAPTAQPLAPDAPSEPAAPTVNAVDRATKLGFAQMLPADTETLMLFQDGKEVSQRFQSTKLWKFIKEQNPALAGSPEDEIGGLSAGDILNEEFFLATGKSTAAQTENLFKINNRYTYHSTKSSVASMIRILTGDEEGGMDELVAMSWMKDLANDPEAGAAWIERSEMPPIYFGCKTNEENAERVEQAFSGFVGNFAGFGPSAEETTFKVGGHSFKGTKISGKILAEGWKENPDTLEQMKEMLGAQTAEDILAAIEKKSLIAASGTVNGYALILLGSRPEDFTFAATPSESIAAAKELSFVDNYLEKKQVGLLFSRKDVLHHMSRSGGISDLCEALRDGIAGNGEFDTRELEAMLDIVAEREKDLLNMDSASDFGALALLDDGFKFETFGGTNLPSLDNKATNKLGDLGKTKDTAIFANWTSNDAYNQKTRDYMEALVETAYATAKIAASYESEDESFAQFSQTFSMFDENFREDAVKVWTALGEQLSEGLGTEGAFLVDLNGEMPPIPNVPQELVNDGRFPRVTMIAPVKDRSKLATSWQNINTSGQNIMKKVSEMMGQEQAMPKPMSSQSNDLTTWFFAGPLFTDDFAPSVTINDKWFIASTSKKKAVDLAKAADQSSSGRNGATMTVDFDALAACAKHWLGAVEKNKDAVFGSNESAAADFDANKDMIREGIDACTELDQLDIHTRKEGDVSRSSLHLKTR